MYFIPKKWGGGGYIFPFNLLFHIDILKEHQNDRQREGNTGRVKGFCLYNGVAKNFYVYKVSFLTMGSWYFLKIILISKEKNIQHLFYSSS